MVVLALGACWACAPVALRPAPVGGPAAGGPAPLAVLANASVRALEGVYTGFGHATRGGGDGPVFQVRSLADAGPGTLRAALAAARAAGGGVVRFAVAGDVVLATGLDVPANTTLDGLTAPAPGITLWGDVVAGARGVVNVLEGNVIVRGLRIRNAANDGIHVAPHRGLSIRGVVIDHCSVTNSADGGIDVTGDGGLTVSDVTLSWNYVAGCGSVCDKGTCGGGALLKYGIDRISVHANLWDANLRRNPSVSGEGSPEGTLADVRGNVVRRYRQSGIQVVGGARANVVGNHLERAGAVYFPDGRVYMEANARGEWGNEPFPFAVEAPLEAVEESAVLAGAGAPPRDEIDELYLHELTRWEEVKGAVPAAPAAAPAGAGRE